MSLMFGSGPFGRDGGRWSFGPVTDQLWYWEDWPRRMRAIFAGETVVDTRATKFLHEIGTFPEHYFPLADVRRDLLVASEARAHDERKGPARLFDLQVGARRAAAVVATYPEPPEGAPPLAGYARFDLGALDRWFEEDDAVYAHPRDPYHRVDVRASSRHVVVRHADQVIAESTRPKLLFETSNPIRYYIPFADVRLDLLEMSDTLSECPYKGDGQHWHVIEGDRLVQDAGWSLPHPLPEGLAAAEHVCFYPEKVEVVVDGGRVEDAPPEWATQANDRSASVKR